MQNTEHLNTPLGSKVNFINVLIWQKKRKKKKNPQGKCNICGKYGALSFEHVPNRAAYNKRTIVEYSLEAEFVQKEKPNRTITQGGAGSYTLCERCNNDTGHWYGGEYTKWAQACYEFLENRKPSSVEPDEAVLTLNNVYPLRFLKQIIVCFFSVIPSLAQTHPDLVKFVLHKGDKQLPENCKFFLNFYFGDKPKLRRWPLAGKIPVRCKDGKLIPLSSLILSEITHPPFALTMSENSGFPGAGDITSFANCDYNQQVKDLTLKLQVIKGNSILPGSFK